MQGEKKKNLFLMLNYETVLEFCNTVTLFSSMADALRYIMFYTFLMEENIHIIKSIN